MTDPLQPDEQRFSQIRKLTEVSRALTEAVSLDDVLQLTVTRAAELLESDRAVLMLADAEGHLKVEATFGLEVEETRFFREPLDETLIRRLQVLLQVAPELFLGVPLVVGGAVTGILAAPLKRPATDYHAWLLSALADQASVAIEKTRLDEQARFRERVIGIVSHDLRTPLGAVVMGARMLLQQPNMSAAGRRMAEIVSHSADRAIRLVRDLLDYTQAQLMARLPVAPRAMDLAVVTRQVVEEARANNARRAIDLETSGDLRGNWDADRMAQVIGNLLTNALDYSPADTAVRIEARAEAETVTLTVHNFGKPIASEQLPRIFEPMQRASSAGREGGSNLGLGLYIVKHLIEAHGGTVAAASDATHGTTLTVRLPR